MDKLTTPTIKRARTNQILSISLLFLSIFTLVSFIGSLTLTPSPSSAETDNSEVDLEVNAVLTLTVGPIVSIPISPSPTGTQSTGDLTVEVATNNETGYTLTMNTIAASTDLSHISESSTLPSVSTDYVSPGALSMNTWGVSIWSPGQVIAPTTFHKVPSLSAPRTIGSTLAPSVTTTKLTFAAKVDTTKIAGLYNNTVVFTALTNFVAPPAPIISSISPETGHFRGGETFTITGKYLTGATSVKLGTSECRTFTVMSDTQISCIASGIATSSLKNAAPEPNLMINPTNKVAVSATTSYGTGTKNNLFTYRYQAKSLVGPNTAGSYTYILGEDIALGSKILVGGVECTNKVIMSSTMAACINTPSLSAGPQAITIQAPPASTGNMQNWTGCSVIPTPNYSTANWWKDPQYTKVLTDTRDNKTYRVRKMPDGRCWMVDNLALATSATISSANTDIQGDAGSDFVTKWNSLNSNGQPVQSSTTHSNGTCTAHSSVSLADGSGQLTCDGANYNANNDGYVAYSDPVKPDNPYTLYYSNCVHQTGISPNSRTSCGYLYNWYTATAGSGNYDTTVSTNVNSSICPAGWRLPKGQAISAQNEFGILNNAMSTGVLTSSITSSATTRPNWRDKGPFEGSLSGYFNTYGFTFTGRIGYYWSSSAFTSATEAYFLNFDSSSVSPWSNFSRHYGMAMRCLV